MLGLYPFIKRASARPCTRGTHARTRMRVGVSCRGTAKIRLSEPLFMLYTPGISWRVLQRPLNFHDV